jgi:O-antigen/teichoic acid export membrane protein
LLTTFGIVAGGILGFAVVVVVTRGLGPVGAGAFFQAVGLFSILVSLVELGAVPGLVRTISRYRAIGRGGDLRGILPVALWPVGSFAALIALGLFVQASPVARLLGLDPEGGGSLFRTLAPFLAPAAVASVTLAAVRGFGRFLPFVAMENLAKPGLRLLLVAIAVSMGFGVDAAVAAWALPAALILVPAGLAVARLLRGVEGDTPARRTRASSLTTEFWRFAAPRGVASVFQMAIVWLDVLLVGSLASTRAAGIYAAVGRLVSLGVFAIEGIRLAVAPQISGTLARNDRTEARLLYRVGTWWLLAASWPLYLSLLWFAPFVLRLFGPEFVEGAPALVIISLGMLVNIATGNVNVVLLMGGKSVWNLANTGAALVTNVVLNLILIPPLGLTGAALAWSASMLVNNLLPLVQVWRFLRIDPFGHGFVVAVALSTLCYGVVGLVFRLALGPTGPGFFIFAAISTLAYLALLWRFRATLRLTSLKDALLSRRGRWIRAGDGVEGPE